METKQKTGHAIEVIVDGISLHFKQVKQAQEHLRSIGIKIGKGAFCNCHYEFSRKDNLGKYRACEINNPFYHPVKPKQVSEGQLLLFSDQYESTTTHPDFHSAKAEQTNEKANRREIAMMVLSSLSQRYGVGKDAAILADEAVRYADALILKLQTT